MHRLPTDIADIATYIMVYKIGGITSCEIDPKKVNLMFYGDIAERAHEDYLETSGIVTAAAVMSWVSAKRIWCIQY